MFRKMRSPAFPPRRPSAILRSLIPAVIICLCYFYLIRGHRRPAAGLYPSNPGSQYQASRPKLAGSQPQAAWQRPEQEPIALQHATPKRKPHPIDKRVETAEREFVDLLSQQSHSVASAASAYRKRRGRHPPPGFDDWFKFAKERNAIIVEDFWDQIYHDLEPFWALPPAKIRKNAWDFEMTINLRNHKASAGSDWFWTQIWLKLIQTVEHLLPDLDIALNAMDEPRLVVPWEKIDEYMAEAGKTRKLVDARDVISEFQTLPKAGEGADRSEQTDDKQWENTRPYWLVARRGCSPDSAARKAEAMAVFNSTPAISPSFGAPHTDHGFVSNYTLSTDFCHQPDLQGLNGIFVEPLTVSATKVLFPMFGGSKLTTNNEILLPAPMYWNEEERFTGGEYHGGPWESKQDVVMWRGVATGGKNRESNWRAFQRHRFVAMNNGTKIDRAESWTELPQNFALPSNAYSLAAQQAGRLGPWVDSWSDVAFIDLMCEYPTDNGGICNYTTPHYQIKDSLKMSDQFGYKFLPDIDGNSFSGRYLGFLRSTSLPIKATVWREWHDSRLVAWKHFVPMDNRYSDWFGIMEYFLGYDDEVAGHDDVAERIASDGKAWAEKVLRKEDMQIYVLRLLLEYARICDEKREKMGWVEDLLPASRWHW